MDKAEEKTAMKISVKSKVKSSKANTVKFDDVFKDNQEVMDWYNNLKNKNAQKGQMIVSKAAVEGRLTYPIKAVAELLKKDKEKISKNKKTCLLFDTLNTTKKIEESYKLIHERYQNNLKPDNIFIN